jgi:hypothetical protein
MNTEPNHASDPASVEMPEPSVAPMVLSLGIVLLAAGLATSYALVAVGGVLFVAGLGLWVGQLLPGRGHAHEPLVEPALRAKPAVAVPGAVERMRQGMPGYRLRLPVKVHPISAGIKGGLVGGLVMPLPAMAYGLISGHGIWLPINLLAGMVLPGVQADKLDQFNATLFLTGALIHATTSLILGLMYGVLMPALPAIPKPLAWGALLMPLMWTAASFVALGFVNPTIRERIQWPWFVLSQFIFGVVAAGVFLRLEKRNPVAAGLEGGIAGGLLMPIPALAWGILTKHGIWYPVNLLSAMAVHQSAEMSDAQLEQFRSDWLIAAVMVHALFSVSFGLALGIVLPKMPAIPGPMAWGGLVMPLLWTTLSYGLMGVVNPVLQQRVDWPWFIASQFVFGLVAAIVVVRSQQVHIPPAGRGPEHLADYVEGTETRS